MSYLVSSRVRRRRIGIGLAVVMVVNTGCYTYQPIVDAQPQVGQTVSLELNDQGRAALSNQLGPGVLSVEGLLQQATNNEYVVSVNSVESIQGGTAHWGGERVTIPSSAVGRSSLRTLARGRSWGLAGAVVLGLVAIIMTRSIIGGGSGTLSDSTSTGLPGQK
jgi:hypothetical protein